MAGDFAIPTQSVDAAARSGGESKAGRWLERIVRMVAVGVPVFYVIGRVYVDAYWDTLGLSPGMAAYDVDDYLFWGFIALVTGSTSALGISGNHTMLLVLTGGLTLSVVTILVILVDHWLTTFVRRRLKIVDERIIEWRRKHHGAISKFGYPAVAIGMGFYALFFVIMGSLLAILAALLVTHKAGQSAGSERIKQFTASTTEQGNKKAAVHYEYGVDATDRALLLDCAPDWCFAFQNGRFFAIPVNSVIKIGDPP